MISREEATVAAAVIAAIFSLASAAISLIAARAAESKAARRGLLKEDLNDFGSALYEIVALSQKMTTRKTDQSFKSARHNAINVSRRLDILRRANRYSLWGLDAGLRTMLWMPVYIAHNKKSPNGKRAKKLITLGTRLRRSLDKAIMNSYLSGKAPGVWHISVVNFRAWHLRAYFEYGGKSRGASPPR